MPTEATEPNNALLHVRGFEGELRCEDRCASVRWSVTIGRHGGIALMFEPITLDSSNKWLFEIAFPSGPLLQRLSISGKTPEGVTCNSNDVYLISHRATSDDRGCRLAISADASRLRLLYGPLPETSAGVRAIYFTVGMRAFGFSEVDTNAGRLRLVGPTKLEQPDDISGGVYIDAPGEVRGLERWLSECDAIILRILDMVSFAEGGLVRWSARRIESDGRLIAIDCEGAKESGPAFDGVFHYLNLQPVLELAVKRYTEELCEKTGFAVALEWFVHHPRYAELQLIAASTALEHLIAVFVQNHGTPKLVSPELFNGLFGAMKGLWQEAAKAANEAERECIARIIGKLGQLNDGSFYDKLVALTDSYTVPLAGIDLKEIKLANDARNAVVHRGLYRRSEERRQLYHYVTILRELLKRIFLTLLGYEGQYFSLLNGPEQRHFPPR
jgi:hypothetical protein